MNDKEYYNDQLVRWEELFYHELSDCAGWKTQFIGVDFIQSKDIKGNTPEEVIENCIKEITGAGICEEMTYSIGGEGILLKLGMKGCVHLPKEAKLKKNGFPIYNCPVTNMIHDQLIEKLGFETTYIADFDVNEKTGECKTKSAIYETINEIGKVSDWSKE